MPVKITRVEAMPAEEFDRLRRARQGRAADAGMAGQPEWRHMPLPEVAALIGEAEAKG